MATQSASFSSYQKYDVFLSFSAVDTLKSFTDHLYTSLIQKGIVTFKDDQRLERGKYVAPELLRAIEGSKYAIIVISENYAHSRWCLTELAKIVECGERTDLVVLPVFYHVDPSDVRNLRGTFAVAFEKHEHDTRVYDGNVHAWREALTKVSSMAGWDLYNG